ncbi:MAG: phage holin family protein [Flavobacteriales bacterium]|jgi:putative membrane protein|nr:phage holin family protein [Flavobacteriales bacterium]MBK9512851.1 phage holin family protein [Flavobacteriales bacterium]MBP7448607.1 phage holin family protein [Flavobacteriales bacterium]HOZ41440.1 phage holin family protein [Flavobacteriales bacterium]
MQLIIRLIITTIAVLVTDLLLSGVHAADFMTGLLVAVVLGLLNTFLKPLLVLLTLPVTLLTLGLFLLVINAGIVLLAARIVPGFVVESFWWALGFSILLSIVQGILQSFDRPKGSEQR